MERVEEALVASERVLPGEGILVAVSGGVDSMLLLEVLHRLVGANRWELTVAHFNHLLRGQEIAMKRLFGQWPLLLGCRLSWDVATSLCWA